MLSSNLYCLICLILPTRSLNSFSVYPVPHESLNLIPFEKGYRGRGQFALRVLSSWVKINRVLVEIWKMGVRVCVLWDFTNFSDDIHHMRPWFYEFAFL